VVKQVFSSDFPQSGFFWGYPKKTGASKIEFVYFFSRTFKKFDLRNKAKQNIYPVGVHKSFAALVLDCPG